MTVAIIPARGGSKRIPRKNILPFNGLPLIAHSLRAAHATGLFSRLIVSTDCPDIARVARQHGGETPFLRPAHLADDFASTDAVIRHALDWLSQTSALPEHACCLYATAPLVDPAHIRAGLDILRQTGAVTAFSVTTYPSPIFRALRLDSRGRLAMLWPEHHTSRSQDLEEVFHDAGQFYWLRVDRYLAEGRIFSGDAAPVHIPRHLVQDIDTPEDWLRAELMHRCLSGTCSPPHPPDAPQGG